MTLKALLCGCAVIAASNYVQAKDELFESNKNQKLHTTPQGGEDGPCINLHPVESSLQENSDPLNKRTSDQQQDASSTPHNDQGMDEPVKSLNVTQTEGVENLRTGIDALQRLALELGEDISQAFTTFLPNTSDTQNKIKLLDLLSSLAVSEDTSEADKEKITQFHALLEQINVKEPSNEEETPQRQTGNEGSPSDDSSDQQNEKVEKTPEGFYSDAEQGEEEEEADGQSQSSHDEEGQENN